VSFEVLPVITSAEASARFDGTGKPDA